MQSLQSLCREVIDANEKHKNELDNYAAKLEAELKNVDKLIAAVEGLENDKLEDPDDSWCIQVEGASKPPAVIDIFETLNTKSPFCLEAGRTARYLSYLQPKPFSEPESRYLEKAIIKENKRLTALRAQQNGHAAFEAVAAPNETFLQSTDGIDWNKIAADVSAWNNPGAPRTPQECRTRWLGFQHPNYNHSESWTDQETEHMFNMVVSQRDSGQKVDWEGIARTLNTGRTALACIKRFQVKDRRSFRWSKDLDAKLTEAVQKYGRGNWNLVATAVSPLLSGNQCQVRYERSVDSSIRKGAFSAEEDQAIISAYRLHPENWSEIARVLPGRSGAQIRSRYILIKKGNLPWTKDEEDKLLAAVKEHSLDWTKVCREMGERRPWTQYATKFETLLLTERLRLHDAGMTQYLALPIPKLVLTPPGVPPTIPQPSMMLNSNGQPIIIYAPIPNQTASQEAGQAGPSTRPAAPAKKSRKRKAAPVEEESNSTGESSSKPPPKPRPTRGSKRKGAPAEDLPSEPVQEENRSTQDPVQPAQDSKPRPQPRPTRRKMQAAHPAEVTSPMPKRKGRPPGRRTSTADVTSSKNADEHPSTIGETNPTEFASTPQFGSSRSKESSTEVIPIVDQEEQPPPKRKRGRPLKKNPSKEIAQVEEGEEEEEDRQGPHVENVTSSPKKRAITSPAIASHSMRTRRSGTQVQETQPDDAS